MKSGLTGCAINELEVAYWRVKERERALHNLHEMKELEKRFDYERLKITKKINGCIITFYRKK